MIPDGFIIFGWLILGAAITVGGIMGFIYLGWFVQKEIDLLGERRRANEIQIKNKVEHEKKLLDLEYERAKAVNESKTRQQIINAMKEE